ncbi:hypothetical protein MRX96_031719 [Rhipicephalus microplus]
MQKEEPKKPVETLRGGGENGMGFLRNRSRKGSQISNEHPPQQLRTYVNRQKQARVAPADENNHGAEEGPQQDTTEGTQSRVLPLLMMAGLIVGVVLGFTVRLADKPWSYRQIMYIGFPGELFQRMMSGISMPLITSSVVAALGSSKPLVLRRVGLCALLLSLVCKCLAVAGALGLSAFLSPGSIVHGDAMVSNATSDIRLSALATDRLVDLIRNLYPSNIMRAHMETTFLLDESYRSANVEKQRLYLAITRGKLGSFFRNMIQPISMALGLASSSQTVPALIVALEEGLQMDPRMARFLGPVGSTVNMDGTTIYLTITLIFFAQKDAMSLGVLQYITIG